MMLSCLTSQAELPKQLLLIFSDSKDTVITPALSANIFPGITRSTLLDVAQSLGIEVIERDVRALELENFDAAFLAATMMELKPLATIHPYPYDSSNHLFHRFKGV